MLELRGISKKFGAFTALDDVHLEVRSGEIVGLLGENGAGKSTLMNIIGGVLTPSAGEMRWNGQMTRWKSPREATRHGIGVVHQHFMLVPVFSVAENVALHAPQAGALYNAAGWEKRVQEWADSLGWRLDGKSLVTELSVGERQRVEILKALFSNPSGQPSRLLLLDEPTTNLTPDEVEDLFAVLRRLREQGRGVVFVSHKLNEVLSICDRVVVLRRGRVVGERQSAETDAQGLATLMVGRDFDAPQLSPDVPQLPSDAAVAAPCLSIKNLSCGLLKDFSLTVRVGEIVGLAGVDGNGQRELAEVLAGSHVPEGGGFEISGANGAPAPRSLLGMIPQDRHYTGLILTFDLAENMALHPALRTECRRPLGFDWRHARRRTRELIEQFDVRVPSSKSSAVAERTTASRLSGGNQQKVVVARALSFPHRAVVAVDPARGLDIAATQFVHSQLRQAAADGSGVLLISTDLDEVLQLSDRIGVLYEGRLLPDENLLPSNVSRREVGALMGGSTASVGAGGGAQQEGGVL